MKAKIVFLSLIAVVALFLWAPGPKRASADPEFPEVPVVDQDAPRGFLIGSGVLCSLDPSACPDVAAAEDRFRMEMIGHGSFTTQPRSIIGGGFFTYKSPTGAVLGTGTWQAVELLDWRSYGGQPDLPASFEGGLAIIGIRGRFSSGFEWTGTLAVDCLIGKFPLTEEEGVKLRVDHGPNFSRTVSGFTLFIRPVGTETLEPEN